MILKNCSVNRFLKSIGAENIICFGAGGYLNNFLNDIIMIDPKQIRFIVDNDEKRQGTYRSIRGREIEVVSLHTALQRISNNDILLITAGFEPGMEIYSQLEKINQLENHSLYWVYFIMESNETRRDMLPLDNIKFHLTDKAMIPKIIHYCWFGKNPIPQRFQEYIDGWRKLCPDYEIVQWNEDNYDVRKHPYMYKAYRDQVWGLVPDYARKDIIYEHGGIYLDTDVEMKKNMDDLLYQEGFCGFESNLVNFGLGFGAVKNLEIMKELRDMYNGVTFEYNQSKMWVGPHYETKKLQEYGLLTNGKYQHIAGLTIYPFYVLSGSNLCINENFITNETYTVHHYSGTWVEDRYKEKKNKLRKMFNGTSKNT